MPRLAANIRISIKNNDTGKSHKIELISQGVPNRRVWVRFDGKNSKKLHDSTISDVSNGLRKLLSKMI